MRAKQSSYLLKRKYSISLIIIELKLMENSRAHTNFNKISDAEVKSALKKFIAFVQFHEISAEMLWDSYDQIDLVEFLNRVEQVLGYDFSSEEISGLIGLCTTSEETLRLKDFELLGLWVNQQPKSKSGSEHKWTINHRASSLTTASKKLRKTTTDQNCFNKLEKNNSKFLSNKSQASRTLLQETCPASNKFKLTEEELDKQILQNSLDKKWEYLIKVGEMNNWIQGMNAPVGLETSSVSHQIQATAEPTIKLYKVESNDEEIRILRENEEGEEETLPLRVFDQKYYSFKKKFTENEKLKNNMKGTMMLVMDGKEKFNRAKLSEKISQRDQELNFILLQVIRAKNVFEQQDKILKECGVNS